MSGTNNRIRFKKAIVEKDKVGKLKSRFGVLIALDLGGDTYTVVGTMNERNPTSILSWLKPLVNDVGIKVNILDTGQSRHSNNQISLT